MRKLNQIIIHCSDSGFGDAAQIDELHKQRGWRCIGYHHVITNGVIHSGTAYNQDDDGVVQAGRPVDAIGAHCLGHNADSIGICLIGQHHFTANQFKALLSLIASYRGRFGITADHVRGHREYDSGKTCPNFDAAWIRGLLA